MDTSEIRFVDSILGFHRKGRISEVVHKKSLAGLDITKVIIENRVRDMITV